MANGPFELEICASHGDHTWLVTFSIGAIGIAGYHSISTKGKEVHSRYWKAQVIAPTIQESVKASIAKFDAEELITQRELANRGIISEQIFITDFKFSAGFQSQIEAKVVAYQEALTQENILKSKLVQAQQKVVEAKGTADAQIERARGEAESIRIINEELSKSPQYLQWQMLNKGMVGCR